ATFMDWGATWLSNCIPMPDGTRRETLLRCATLREQLQQSAYLGATVGRFTNRINQGVYEADGQRIQLVCNDQENSLHGGPAGFSQRRWRIVEQSSQAVTFSLVSADGDQGFPGNLHVRATYMLSDDHTVGVRFHAVTDSVTPVSLTNHAYFNLDEHHPCVLDHTLCIHAADYIPVNARGIPSEPPAPVEGTPWDFRQTRCIRENVQRAHPPLEGYDHAFMLMPTGHAPAVTLTDSRAQVQLAIHTDMPALQVYTGNHLDQEKYASHAYFARHQGIALETAFPPDCPNQPHLPDCLLQPGATYQSQTEFRFKVLPAASD
ncbi:MAG: galactose-1-epimerase, partial [Pseudomonadota bacterium]